MLIYRHYTADFFFIIAYPPQKRNGNPEILLGDPGALKEDKKFASDLHRC